MFLKLIADTSCKYGDVITNWKKKFDVANVSIVTKTGQNNTNEKTLTLNEKPTHILAKYLI